MSRSKAKRLDRLEQSIRIRNDRSPVPPQVAAKGVAAATAWRRERLCIPAVELPPVRPDSP